MTRLTIKCLLVFVLMFATGLAEQESLTETQMKAEKGYAPAQFNLGVMYTVGRGVPKDAVEAVKWLRKAAVQGNAPAQYNLGLMYANGDGVPKDAVEAVKWLRKAAEQGYVFAQFNLGVIYANGDGVLKDAVEAHAWLNVAGANGNEEAKENLAKIEKEMTKEQIAEATKLARIRFEKLQKKK
jgi:TPR repeat protein